MDPHALIEALDARITYDEIGLAHGHFDGQLLKTAFQPMFRMQQAVIVPEAVRGLARPNLMGRPTPPRILFERRGRREHFLLECLCRALHLANLPYLDLETRLLSLSFDVVAHDELDAAVAALSTGIRRLEEEGHDAPQVTAEIGAAGPVDLGLLEETAARLRAAGCRVAVAGFGPDEAWVGATARIEPDYVRLDGGWFRTVVRAPAVVPLLAGLVEQLHAKGIQVVAEGIETPAQFEAAIAIAADQFAGYWLQPPAAAGELMPAQPKHVPLLLDRSAKVVPIRRPA